VGEPTLLRFYVGHCIFLPFIAATLMAVHFWRVRKDGGISGPVVSTKASEGAKYIAEKMAQKRISQIKGVPANGAAKPAAPAKAAPAPKPAAAPAAAPIAGAAPAAPSAGGAKAPPPWLKK